MGTPATYKNNAFTQLADAVRVHNKSGGAIPIEVGGGPSVRTRAMDPPPLSAEEKARRDAAARDLGIIDREPGDEATGYDTFEQAAAAGASVPRSGELAQLERDRTSSRESARGMVPFAPRLPDFTKVQIFDFVQNVIVVDGMSFPIPAQDVLEMKGYAVQVALDHVVVKLAEALMAFGLPPAAARAAADKLKETVNGEGADAVQGVRVDGHPTDVSEELGPHLPLVQPAAQEGGEGSVPA